MGGDGRPAGQAIHATAVAIGDRALVILGPSKAGKSRLAIALIGASTRPLPVVLIGDDRLLLRSGADGLYARAHPRIAGFIERRGLGLVAMPFRDEARIAGLVALGSATTRVASLQNFPTWRIVTGEDAAESGQRILAWFADLQNATCATQRHAKMVAHDATMSKD